MKKAFRTSAFFALLAVTLVGCMKQYMIGDEVFYSREQADLRHNEQINHTLLGIHPTKTPVDGTALISLPILEEIERTGIRVIAGSRSAIPSWQKEYLCDFLMREYEAMVNALKQRGIFDDVIMTKSADPPGVSMEGYAFLIYLFNPSSGVAGWYIKGQDWVGPQAVRMEGNDRLAKTLSWLASIEELAHNK